MSPCCMPATPSLPFTRMALCLRTAASPPIASTLFLKMSAAEGRLAGCAGAAGVGVEGAAAGAPGSGITGSLFVGGCGGVACGVPVGAEPNEPPDCASVAGVASRTSAKSAVASVVDRMEAKG